MKLERDMLAAARETGCTDLASNSLKVIADHIRDLVRKAHTQGSGQLDQTLLLRSLADRLRGSNGFGAFASDTLIKLGLLGTIIGFIIMLAPIAGLDAADRTFDRHGADLRRWPGKRGIGIERAAAVHGEIAEAKALADHDRHARHAGMAFA